MISKFLIILLVITIMYILLVLFGVISSDNCFFNRAKSSEGVDGIKRMKEVGNHAQTQVMPSGAFCHISKYGQVLKTYPIFSQGKFKRKLVVGTSERADIVIEGSVYISKKHAYYIERKKDKCLVDNKSKNGIFDAEHNKVNKIKLEEGTVFYLADMKFIYSIYNESVGYRKKHIMDEAHIIRID